MTGAGERILVTGATGFLGREIIGRLLRQRPAARLVLLVRGEDDSLARRRAERALAGPDGSAAVAGNADRIEVLRADITADRCGLDPRGYDAAVTGLTHIIHAAAAVAFDEAPDLARRINVDGTRRVLALADAAVREGRLRSLSYLSTAFVAGCRTGLVREDELDVGQAFRNAYEQTKCEAEALVRQHAGRLPTVIARPSIVVGSSETGSTSSFRMLYWPLRVYATGRWRTVPGYADTVIDLVPVDFVARAVAHLAFEDRAIGQTVHLCAGPEGDTTAGECAQAAARFFQRPPPRFVSPLLYGAIIRPIARLAASRATARTLDQGRVYRPYFDMNLRFDTAAARALLGPAGLAPPKVTDYLERVFRYCRDSDWGRHPPRPAAPDVAAPGGAR
jgi:long-chain acyl-CoA synthetase